MNDLLPPLSLLPGVFLPVTVHTRHCSSGLRTSLPFFLCWCFTFRSTPTCQSPEWNPNHLLEAGDLLLSPVSPYLKEITSFLTAGLVPSEGLCIVLLNFRLRVSPPEHPLHPLFTGLLPPILNFSYISLWLCFRIPSWLHHFIYIYWEAVKQIQS